MGGLRFRVIFCLKFIPLCLRKSILQFGDSLFPTVIKEDYFEYLNKFGNKLADFGWVLGHGKACFELEKIEYYNCFVIYSAYNRF